MAHAEPRTRILVVSLRSAEARRRAFAEAAGSAAGLEWSFFDASESLHPALSYDEEDAVVAKGRPLTKGEIGCYSSHYEAWRQLLEGDHDQYLVLEDDVIADWDYLAAFVRMNHEAAGRDYIRLYYKKPAPVRVLERDFGSRTRWLTRVIGYAFGTQAYLITRGAARVFTERFRRVRRPIDDEMDRWWVHGVSNLAVFPFPVMERAQESGIGLGRFEAFDVPARLKLRRTIAHQRERAGYHLFARARSLLAP
ncbi:glycosyltransferase family 25 protein [Sphingosinicella sp. CPCC 101087]|uniref:glycosyltransferase family 25 protein n=1 Tax=Sphingosinicella sp. CPCC 101087 TaxID=2497754 RepID=UPI00101C7C5B|nr:glycosyltransferase family 25 protein [Sphingosinicella sp. CPCC 101087]